MKKLLKFCLFLVLAIPVFFFFSIWFLTDECPTIHKADVIIVLGFPSNPDGTISITQKSRVDGGIKLFSKKLAPKMMFTGGAAYNSSVEAETMRDYAISKGVPAEHIFVETESTNTHENAFLSYKILDAQGCKDVIVVTSSYHTRRANHLFTDFKLNVQTKAAPYPAALGISGRAKAMLHEYAAYTHHYILKIFGQTDAQKVLSEVIKSPNSRASWNL